MPPSCTPRRGLPLPLLNRAKAPGIEPTPLPSPPPSDRRPPRFEHALVAPGPPRATQGPRRGPPRLSIPPGARNCVGTGRADAGVLHTSIPAGLGRAPARRRRPLSAVAVRTIRAQGEFLAPCLSSSPSARSPHAPGRRCRMPPCRGHRIGAHRSRHLTGRNKNVLARPCPRPGLILGRPEAGLFGQCPGLHASLGRPLGRVLRAAPRPAVRPGRFGGRPDWKLFPLFRK